MDQAEMAVQSYAPCASLLNALPRACRRATHARVHAAFEKLFTWILLTIARLSIGQSVPSSFHRQLKRSVASDFLTKHELSLLENGRG